MHKTETVKYATEEIIIMYKLRELERQDMTIINQWRNDPEVIKYLGAPYRYINLDTDLKWFDNYMANRNATVRCAIIDENDSIVGLASLTSIDHINQSAVFQIMIGEAEHQNNGAGTFATKTLLEHAFFNLNIQRVELEVLADNERAIHMYEKVGFVREGIMRKSRYKNGKFVDMVILALLREDYKQNYI